MTRLTNASYVKIGLLVLLAVVLCGGIVSCSVRCTPEFHYNDAGVAAKEVGAASVEGESVQNIVINWAAGSATVTVCDDSETDGQVVFTESASGAIPRGQVMRWGCDNGTLVIDFAQTNSISGCSGHSKRLNVKVPKSVAESLGRFTLNAASGTYTIDDLSCKEMDIEIASGTVKGSRLTVDKLVVNAASGRVDLDGEFADRLSLEQASGHIGIVTSVCPKEAAMSMMSGDTSLTLPEDSAFTINTDKLSGNIRNDFPQRSGSQGGTGPGSSSATYGAADAEVTGSFTIDMASGSVEFRSAG